MMQPTLQNFKLLHNHLVSILSTNNFDNQHLPDKVMQYIGMIVESQKNPKQAEDFFDFFCEHNGNKILKLTLEADPFLAVKVLSMLLINLKSQNWISFLLCQSFVIDSIQCTDLPDEEEWAEYYISLLKSLSIRLDTSHLSLFFNKKFPKFPLLYEALKYYNHPDCMVRTNVMNIILGIMKIKDQRLNQYFSKFPFISYILTYCCQIKDRIHKFNLHLLEWDYSTKQQQSKMIPSQHKSIVKMYFIDLLDYICYLNDLMELGPVGLAYFIQNCIYVYLLLPALYNLREQSLPILKKSSLYLIFTLLKTINDDSFKQTVCLLLLGKQIPKYFQQKMLKIQEQMYVPKIYSDTFSLKQYYWNKFDYQIQKQSLELFEDISNFETEHQKKEQDKDITDEFDEQIKKISNFVGFNIFNFEFVNGSAPYSELKNILNFSKSKNKVDLDQGQLKLEKNVIRQSVFSLFEQSCNQIDDDFCLQTSILFNYCTKTQGISNNILKFSGLLMPRFDLKNYVDEYNLESLLKLKNYIFSSIIFFNKNFEAENPKIDCSLATLRNIVTILHNLLYKRLPEDQQINLLRFYDKTLIQLKKLMTLKNMKDMVQNFQFDYAKWNKQALMSDHNLPFSLFHLKSENLLGQVDLHYLKQLDDHAKVQYFIRYFAIFQSFYYKYIQQFIIKEGLPTPVLIQKYHVRYTEKFGKVEERWKLGNSYTIQSRHIIECKSIEKNNKLRKLFLVQDNHNIIIVEPSDEQNSAKIIINHPWKYVDLEIDRTNGKRMMIKISKCIRSESHLNLIFLDEIRSASTLQWMNHLKHERYQSEQALILSYIKDCLVRN